MSTNTLYLGIDPANSGAAVLLHNRTAVVSVVWSPCTRNKRKAFKLHLLEFVDDRVLEREVIVRHPAAIGREISQACRNYSAKLEGSSVQFYITTEDAYVGRNAKTGLLVARFGGQVSGVCEADLDSKSLWVLAASWRAKILRLPAFTKRAKAKAVSMAVIPKWAKNVDTIIKKCGELDHITDAVGVALWRELNTK